MDKDQLPQSTPKGPLHLNKVLLSVLWSSANFSVQLSKSGGIVTGEK